jgi:ADP-L-glycero-D-manno-heptose 6-epimerase
MIANFAERHRARFVYASSGATYGHGEKGFDDDLLFELSPLNMYGYSKHMFDTWLMFNKQVENFIGLKYFNVYGPGEFHKGNMRSIILKAYEQIKTTGKLQLFELKQESKRDFIYIDDAVKATLFFMNREKHIRNGLYNVGTGNARTWKDLAIAIFDAMGLPCNIQYIKMPYELKDQYQYITEADITSLRKVGYDSSMMSIEEGVKSYIDYLEK